MYEGNVMEQKFILSIMQSVADMDPVTPAMDEGDTDCYTVINVL